MQRYKVAFVGEARVGKTSLIRVLFGNEFREGQPSSICDDPFAGEFTGTNGARVWLEVWDTTGQDTVLETATTFIRGSALIMIVFNLCDTSTLMACSEWAHNVRLKLGDDPQLLLVGTQHDRDLDRRVPSGLAHDKASEIGALFIETSAKSGHNVDTLKSLLVQLCTQSSLQLLRPSNLVKLTANATEPRNAQVALGSRSDPCSC